LKTHRTWISRSPRSYSFGKIRAQTYCVFWISCPSHRSTDSVECSSFLRGC
jgi:hypothetical protein